MRVDFQSRVVNRGITKTSQSLQTSNDFLGKALMEKPQKTPVDVKKIMENKQLMQMAQDFYNKFIK